MANKSKLLIEEVIGKPGRVDVEQGILYDCLLLGTTSRNGTNYPDDTRERAVPLFEGAKINLSHPAKRDKSALAESTPWDRRYGKAFDAHNTPNGIVGNVKVLKKHTFTQTLMEAAQEMPDMFGFSPVMLGVCSARDANGVETCMEIKRVKCVDIVTDPGTTKSLFEEEAPETPKEEAKETPQEEHEEQEQGPHHEAALMHVILDEIEEFLDKKRDAGEASSRVEKHLKHHAKMFHGEEGEEKEEPKEEKKEEYKEEEHHWNRVIRGTKVLTEEVKKPVEIKKVKSGVRPNGDAGPNWMSILRK